MRHCGFDYDFEKPRGNRGLPLSKRGGNPKRAFTAKPPPKRKRAVNEERADSQMDPLELVLSENKCVSVRIDLTKDFNITVLGKNINLPKKQRKFNLKDKIYHDDLPPFAEAINVMTATKQKRFSTHCRLSLGGDYHWFYFYCRLEKDTFGKLPYMIGTMLDVSEYLENADEDLVMKEFKKKNSSKISEINHNDASLVELLDRNYLCNLQKAFEIRDGVATAMFDDQGRLICTADPTENKFNADKYKFTVSEPIIVNHQNLAKWTIASNEQLQIERYTPLLETLAKTVSQNANAFVILYNEMENSQKANRMLGENVEQQIILNNIYSVVLENTDPRVALSEVIKLIGEYFVMDRIAIFEDVRSDDMVYQRYEWAKSPEYGKKMPPFPRSRFARLEESLNDNDTYFVSGEDTELSASGIKAYAAARVSDEANFTGIVMFQHFENCHVWTTSDKTLIRRISQILSMMVIQCKMYDSIEEKNEQLKKLAFCDIALGFPNRLKLDSDIEELIDDENRKAALLALKVTNMRNVNEVFGHAYTDLLLKSVAEYISHIRSDEKTVYRFTGNILMILLYDIDTKEAKRFAEQIVIRFREPWSNVEGSHYLEMGIGITMLPENGHTPEEIYRAATLSMYRAIEFGKNRYAFYSREFEKPSDSSYFIEQRMRHSLNNNMEGFSLCYQPTFDIETGKPVYFEAYIRWNDEALGEIAPRTFIKMAEKLGFDFKIDSWVLCESCTFAKKMQKESDEEFSVAVNLTASELRSPEIVQAVSDALKISGLSARHLILEIPEKAQAKAFADTAGVFGKLKKLGVSIVIDNFGGEYMSLGTLKCSYIDTIKMSQSLLTSAYDDFDKTLVDTIIELSHERGISVCIKEVDRPEQMDIIKDFGADWVQGYLCAMPMKANKVKSWEYGGVIGMNNDNAQYLANPNTL